MERRQPRHRRQLVETRILDLAIFAKKEPAIAVQLYAGFEKLLTKPFRHKQHKDFVKVEEQALEVERRQKDD